MDSSNVGFKTKEMECIKCAVTLNSVSEYSDHYRKFHAGLDPHSCSMCDIHLPTVSEFQKHMQQHYNKTPVSTADLDIQAPSTGDIQAQQNEQGSNFSVSTPIHSKRSAFLQASKRVKDISMEYNQSGQSEDSSPDDQSEYEESDNSGSSRGNRQLKHILNRPIKMTISKESPISSFLCNKCQSAQPSVEMAKLCCAVGPFKCFVCLLPMESKTTCMNHLRDRHQIKTVFQCYNDVVLNKQPNNDKQKIQFEKKEKDKSSVEPAFGQMNLHKDAWSEKINNVGNIVIQCRICNVTVPTMDAFTKHFDDHTVTMNGLTGFQCKICFEIIYRLSNFLKHNREHFSQSQYPEKIEKISNEPDEDNPVEITDTDVTVKSEPIEEIPQPDSAYRTPCFKCEQCQTLQPSYEMAMLCCHTGNEFPCYHCEKVIINRAGLISHYAHKHNVKTSFLQSKRVGINKIELNRDRPENDKNWLFFQDKCHKIDAINKGRPSVHFKCKLCNHKAFSPHTFKMHYRNTHRPDQNQHSIKLKTEKDAPKSTGYYTFEEFCQDTSKCTMIPTTSKCGKAKVHYHCKLCNITRNYTCLFKKHFVTNHRSMVSTKTHANSQTSPSYKPSKSRTKRINSRLRVENMYNKVLKTTKVKNRTQEYYECRICLKQIRKSGDLKRHLRKHKEGKPIIKKEKLKTIQSAPIKIDSVHDKYPEDKYTVDGLESESYIKHDDIPNDMPSFSCDKCERKHPSHEKAVLCCETGCLTCPVCQEMYTGKVAMNRHLVNAHNILTRWPDKKHSNEEDLGTYSLVMHKSKPAFQCKLCQRTCFSLKTFNLHHKWVHGKGKTSEPLSVRTSPTFDDTKQEKLDNTQEGRNTTESQSKVIVENEPEEEESTEILDQDDTEMEAEMEEKSDKDWMPSDGEHVESKSEGGNDRNYRYTIKVRNSAKSAKDKIFNDSTRGRKRKWIDKTSCQKCDLTFELQSDLKTHINLHNSYKLCVYCNCIRKNIYHHVSKAHSNKLSEWKNLYQKNSDKEAVVVPPDVSQIVCSICAKAFTDPYKFSHHVHMHKDLTQCVHCKKMVRPNKISYHARKLCKKYQYQNYGYKLSNNSKQNMTLQHRSTTKITVQAHCKKCGTYFLNMAELEHHYKNNTLCFQKTGAPQVGKQFSNVTQDAKVHRKKAKKIKQDHRVQCKICFKVFDNRSGLSAHSTSHFEKRKCDFCPRMLQAGMERHITRFHKSKLPEWRMRHFPKLWKGKYIKIKFTYKDGRIGYRWRLKTTQVPNGEPPEAIDDISGLNNVETSNLVPLQSQFDTRLQCDIQEERPAVHETLIEPYSHISQISSIQSSAEDQQSEENDEYSDVAPKDKNDEMFEEIKIELNKEFEEEDDEFQPMIISVTSVKDHNEQVSNEGDIEGISTEQCNSPSIDYLPSNSEMTNKDSTTIEQIFINQDDTNKPLNAEASKAISTSLTNGELNHDPNNTPREQFKTIAQILENVNDDSTLKSMTETDDSRSTDGKKVKNGDNITNYNKSVVINNITGQEFNTHTNLISNTDTEIDRNKVINLNDSEVMNNIYFEKSERLAKPLTGNGTISHCKVIAENKQGNEHSRATLEVSSDSILAQHNGALYECKLCKIIFLNETVHWQHMSTHAMSGQPFACNHCKNTFTNAIDFHAHFISKYQKHL
ncbi:unnamed protein product [Owenia fusiformis]|uniref:C2H2-type domain-containing protein n=1 Tax=Owenia fusiformis TaxID=6347 RepID=A0A8S4Q012_OWEFU|nr:unnamed protein product [Owenia fusiformis]